MRTVPIELESSMETITRGVSLEDFANAAFVVLVDKCEEEGRNILEVADLFRDSIYKAVAIVKNGCSDGQKKKAREGE